MRLGFSMKNVFQKYFPFLVMSLILLGLLSVGMLAVRVSAEYISPVEVSPRTKEFSRLIAEGFRYRDMALIGVDRCSFKSCHIEKMKKGHLTFGAFNVLVIDGLLVNIPPVDAPLPSKGVRAGVKKDSLDSWGGIGSFLGGHEQKISGLKINGLIVNQCISNQVKPILHAAVGRASGGSTLKLENCWIINEGSSNYLTKAELVFGAQKVLKYQSRGRLVSRILQ